MVPAERSPGKQLLLLAEIVIRANGVEAEFPSDTDIGILAAFVKALGHA